MSQMPDSENQTKSADQLEYDSIYQKGERLDRRFKWPTYALIIATFFMAQNMAPADQPHLIEPSIAGPTTVLLVFLIFTSFLVHFHMFDELTRRSLAVSRRITRANSL